METEYQLLMLQQHVYKASQLSNYLSFSKENKNYAIKFSPKVLHKLREGYEVKKLSGSLILYLKVVEEGAKGSTLTKYRVKLDKANSTSTQYHCLYFKDLGSPKVPSLALELEDYKKFWWLYFRQ